MFYKSTKVKRNEGDLNMADINLIRDITNAFGPSGFEEEVCRVIKNYTEGFDVTNDARCNVYMKRKDFVKDESKEGIFASKKPVLMLDAHSDECGMMIQGIRENGRANCSLTKHSRNGNKLAEQGNEILEYSWFKNG